MKAVTRLLPALALAGAAAPANAQEAPPPPAAVQAPAAESPALVQKRNLVERKTHLVERMLSDSPTARRIAESGDETAIRHLAAAQEKLNEARTLLQKGALDEAEAALNEAMSNVGKARQLVPDRRSQQVESRVRYYQMVAGVESLLASFRERVERTSGDGAAPARDALQKASQLVEQARSLANVDRMVDANRMLAAAEQTLLTEFSRLLGSDVVYSQSFASEEEEYRFELARAKSYEELIPVALAELKPSEGARKLIDRYVSDARGRKAVAEEKAGKKDYQAALGDVRECVKILQRALLAAGVTLPPQ